MNNAPLYPALVSAAIILGNLLVGLILFYRNWRFVNNALTATGTVIELKKRGQSKGGNPMYSPVVRFFAADGNPIEFTEFLRRHPPGFEVGEQVTVFYDRRNFKKARTVKSQWDLYFPAWIFLLIGSVLLLGFALLTLVFVAANLLLAPPKSKLMIFVGLLI